MDLSHMAVVHPLPWRHNPHLEVVTMCLSTPVVLFSWLWQNTQHKQGEQGRACLGSQFGGAICHGGEAW